MPFLRFKWSQFWSWFLSCWYPNHAWWFHPSWLSHRPTILLFGLHLQARISKIQSTLAHLPDLHESQIECSLLRSCLSLPKIAFALRTCPPDFIYPALTAFDNLIGEALSQLVSSPLSNWFWSKASLPSSLGGINLRQAVLHAPAAYIGSLVQSLTEILGFQPSYPTSLSSAIKVLGSTLGHPGWSELSDIELPLCQRSISLAIDLSGHSLLLESAPDTPLADLGGSQGAREPPLILNSVLMVSLPSVILYKHLLKSHRLLVVNPPFDFSRSASVPVLRHLLNLLPSVMLVIGWTSSLLLLWVCTCLTKNLGFAFATGWGSPSSL